MERRVMEETDARRRLFSKDALPLNNCAFYLDLHGYSNMRSLQDKIEHLGGRVEQFLSKEVNCVITNNDINAAQTLRRSPRTATISSIKKPISRAQGILEKAKQKREGKQKTNVISVAKGLGIRVKHVDEVIAWLEQASTQIDKKENIENQENDTGRKKNSRQLKSPFMKIEDQSRLYQPLFKEFEQWPTMNFDTQPPECPFDPPRSRVIKAGERSGQGSSTSSSTKDQRFRGETIRATGHQGSSQKIGYCELCKANYRGLKRHLEGAKHKKNAANSTAYKELDETIREGKTINEYFKELELQDAGATPEKFNQSKTNGNCMRTPVKNVTPLKITFSPRAGYSVVKTEIAARGHLETYNDTEQHDNLIITKTPRKRHVDEYSVVWMSELTMKIRRSTRLLRGSTSDQHGSVYVDFPVFKEAHLHKEDTQITGHQNTSTEDSTMIQTYGDVQGKIRLSTRILDAENQQGLEEFDCPMYVESSEQ